MDLAQQKEQFSVAFLRAVAATAGYRVSKPSVDDDSVDWTLAAGGELARRPKVDLQLKCTSRAVLRPDALAYPLEIKNYDDLRDPEVMVPRLLLIVVAPERTEDWIAQTEQSLSLLHCGYWASLRGLGTTDNMTSVTISIPRLNQFSPPSLCAVMERLSRGEMLDAGTTL